MFDTLNSKSKFRRQYKSPLKLDNLAELEGYLNDTIAYLKKLKDTDGIKLIDGPWKTYIIGFAISSKSILALAKQLPWPEITNMQDLRMSQISPIMAARCLMLINGEIKYSQNKIVYRLLRASAELRQTCNGHSKVKTHSSTNIVNTLYTRSCNKYEYLFTYRFSQDQVKMFFSKIRSRLGWNNNPNALQFKWALRALLQKKQIAAAETGNCTVIEDKLNEEIESLDSRIIDYLNCSPIWRDDVLDYIGGYIVKKITTCIKCPECAIALIADNDNQAALPDHSYCQSK